VDVRALSAPASCPNCGTALASDARFCPTCGRATAQIQPGTCPKCGAGKVQGHNYCPSCGFPLTPILRASESLRQTTAGSGYSQVPPAYQRDRDFQEMMAIGRTKNGLLLLAVSGLLAPIPILNYIGGILAIVGAVLMILGRGAFGDAHSRNVVLSVVIYIVGLVILFIEGVSFALSISSIELSGASGASAAAAISSSFNDLLTGAIVVGAILGVATILFTYAIQSQTGRILLLAGYVSSLLIGILVFSIIGPQLSTVVSNSIATRSVDRSGIDALQSDIQLLRFLNFIPGIIYAVAYYRLWERIDMGDLP
jgi:ribosomal protein L37E